MIKENVYEEFFDVKKSIHYLIAHVVQPGIKIVLV